MSFLENVGRRQTIQQGELGAFVNPGSQSLNGYERNVLFRNLGHLDQERQAVVPSFYDFGYLEGADCIEDGRGAAVSDIDGDGDLDLLVQNMGHPVGLLVNQGRHPGNWLQVSLQGAAGQRTAGRGTARHRTLSNRDAVGARVSIVAAGRRQTREVTSASGYLTGQSLVCHFGLADVNKVERLEVLWPSGGRTVLTDIPANQRIQVVESRE